MIIREVRGHVVLLTMQGDSDLNLSVMDDELYARVNEYLEDDALRCAIITAAGMRAFSAGADFKKLNEGKFGLDFWSEPAGNFINSAGVKKPLIAAVNGHAIGAGMMVALACDIRIASDNATFGLPEVKFGFPPILGATQRLARVMPLGPALQMLMTGQSISAAQAERWGLVNQVVPSAELLPAAFALAEMIAANPPIAVSACKELAWRAADMPLEQGLRLEASLQQVARKTEDSAEALRALKEKRKPKFERR